MKKEMTSDLPVWCFSSCVAGLVGRVFCHPLDTLKARLQAEGPAITGGRISMLGVAKSTFLSEGIRGFYRGFSAVAIGGTPATCIYLTSYEISKASLEGATGAKSGALIHLTSGLLAETISCIVFVPVDVVKERLQVQRPASVGGIGPVPYSSSYDALRTIVRTEGLKGIYRGYFATLASFGPFSALYFGFYEHFKRSVQGQQERELGPAITLGCASFSGALAAWVTSPLDMAKLRMQVERGKKNSKGNKGPPKYTTMAKSLKHILRSEGVAGLWRGSVARMVFTAPNTAITMAVYEKVKAATGS
mmetsp:Transcript_57536/g.130369  ORF Transcript_57536/g.130369 Transcript_57536/m.130369 type:complete len:305 (-) Transcript_57536:238-1152(-)|eukprot:CAMPEP_0172628908 /NCGR_PEP_ID=MMETSP1068-20121228/164545_1 /TAXON_ID=35684 /ORGANISM="Pseudopedinella elastica, Strain CCMP716" /LENGTH=304 /DNA_ID=CAMNT_0013439281 /DNA_START=103 /DNA_END=1017 /DNA_ORIENTATION=-